ITPNGVCDPDAGTQDFTGQIDAEVSFGGTVVTDLSNYSFYWYAGETATGTPILSGQNLPTLSNVDGGKYTLVVTNDEVNCRSVSATYTVPNSESLPNVTVA